MTKSRVQINRSSVTRQRPVDRDSGELYVNFADLQIGVVNPINNPMDLVAVRFHSVEASYVEGEFVVENGELYKAIAPSLPGEFAPANWLAVSSEVVYWDDVQSKPATFPPALPILQTDVIGLTDELAGKLEDAPSDGEQYARQDAAWVVVDAGGSTDWADITGKPATFPPTLPIAQSGVTDLATDLAGKAAAVHTHAQADVTNLVTDLAGKAAAVHTHVMVDVTDLAAALALKADLVAPLFTGNARSTTPPTADNDTSIATTAHVQANMALKADIASPSFTGTPLAPTAAFGNLTTQLATTTFVQVHGTTLTPFSGRYSITTSPGTPSTGSIRTGNASSAAVTALNIHYTDSDVIDRKEKWLATIKQGAWLAIQDSNPTSDWVLFKVTGAPTDNTTWMAVPVAYVAGSATQPGGQSMLTLTHVPMPGDSIHVGTTAPASPITNDLWLDIN